jgi:hypothetical protein
MMTTLAPPPTLRHCLIWTISIENEGNNMHENKNKTNIHK